MASRRRPRAPRPQPSAPWGVQGGVGGQEREEGGGKGGGGGGEGGRTSRSRSTPWAPCASTIAFRVSVLMAGSLVYGHFGLSDGAPSPDPPRVTYLTSAVSFSPHFSSFV